MPLYPDVNKAYTRTSSIFLFYIPLYLEVKQADTCPVRMPLFLGVQ